MNAATKASELGPARIRASELLKRVSVERAAQWMAAEFHLCIYASRGVIYGSLYETDKKETVFKIAPLGE